MKLVLNFAKFQGVERQIGCYSALNSSEISSHPSKQNSLIYPYEIHITVPADGVDITNFKDACSSLAVKPIVLDLEINGRKPLKDVMTSSKMKGSDEEAFTEMRRISDGLKDFGFPVIREKIETAPWHHTAPSIARDNLEMPANCYFECHFGVQIKAVERQQLKDYIDSFKHIGKLHLSANAFKQQSEDIVLMATYRRYDGAQEEFEEKVGIFTEKLRQRFQIEKVISEFSMFDTKVDHDKNWLEGGIDQGVEDMVNPCVSCKEVCPFKVKSNPMLIGNILPLIK